MRKGFTLIEVALVIGIVALLSILIMVNYHSYYLRQTTLAAAQSIKSDLDFSVQHALAQGIANNIRYNASSSLFEVVDPSGTIKATQIPANVQVAVSGFSNANPANAATADIVPGGDWIGFLPQGTTVTGQAALVVVASSSTWYVISIETTGQVAGPTQNRSQIPLSNSELSSLLSNQGMQMNISMQPSQNTTSQNNIPTTLANQIESAWHI